MNYLLWVSFLSLFILGFADNIRGPLFPEIIKYFSLSDSQASWYFALSSLVAVFASYFIRHIHRVSGFLNILYWGVLCIGFGFLIQSFVNSYSLVLCGVFLLGISWGFLGVAQNNLAIIGTTPENRSSMLSILHSMYGIASLLAPLYVAFLSSWSWKEILLPVAIVSILFCVIGCYSLYKMVDKIKPFEKQHEEPHQRIVGIKNLSISFVISLYVMTEIMVGTRLALFMRRYFDYDLKDSSFYVTLFYVALLGGRLIASFKPPKWPLRIQLYVSLLGSAVLVMIGSFVHPLGFVLSGFTMAPFYPLSMSYISRLFPKSSSAVVSWTITIQSFFIVSMHWIVGGLTDKFGLKIAMLGGPIALLSGLFILLFIKETESS